jgi:hypothetical protein
VYRQLVRSLPAGQKKLQVPDQLPRPPVLARQAVFLLLRRPEELEADEQETLALLRSLHPEVEQVYVLVQQFAHPARARAPDNSSPLGLRKPESATFVSCRALSLA